VRAGAEVVVDGGAQAFFVGPVIEMTGSRFSGLGLACCEGELSIENGDTVFFGQIHSLGTAMQLGPVAFGGLPVVPSQNPSGLKAQETTCFRRRRNDKPETRVELKSWVDPQYPKLQRHTRELSFFHRPRHQSRSDAPALMLGNDEYLVRIKIIGQCVEAPETGLLTFNLNDLQPACDDVFPHTRLDRSFVPGAPHLYDVVAHRFSP